jgi:hypothetical protein
MNNFLGGGLGFFLQTAMDEMFTYENNREQWKESIKRKFRESRNLPRKKKKQVRKELQLDWRIANWDPFKF